MGGQMFKSRSLHHTARPLFAEPIFLKPPGVGMDDGNCVSSQELPQSSETVRPHPELPQSSETVCPAKSCRNHGNCVSCASGVLGVGVIVGNCVSTDIQDTQDTQFLIVPLTF
jgi:hypothetical protein